MLKAAAATTAGAALFSGTASATDDTPIIDLECTGDEIKVTLKQIERITSDERVEPTDPEISEIEIFLGKFHVIDYTRPGGGDPNGQIDAGAEIRPCLEGTPECSPIARPNSPPEVVGDDICYTFDRADAALDSVTSPVDIGVAGTYRDSRVTGRKQPLTFDTVTSFDPSTCCIECETGDDLLVKYEWDDDTGEFFVEKGGDDDITLTGVTLDEDGEPEEACFTTTYCGLEAVVKASNEYAVTPVDGEFCVSGIDQHAISNVRFYCVAPDDLGVGNSGKNDENGKGGENGKGKGR
jgi:hypothetical protein